MKINEIVNNEVLDINSYKENFNPFNIASGTAMTDGKYNWRFRKSLGIHSGPSITAFQD